MPDRIELCPAGTLAIGEMRRFEPAGRDPVLLINDAGTLRLIDDDCTHAIASLSRGKLEGTTIFCPVHRGSFDIRSGKALGLPCRTPLRTYAVTVADGKVWAEL